MVLKEDMEERSLVYVCESVCGVCVYTEYTLFFNVSETFSKIDPMLGHKT